MSKAIGEMFRDASDTLRYKRCGSVVPLYWTGEPMSYADFCAQRKAIRRAGRMADRTLAQIRDLRPKTFPRYDMARGARG